MRCGDASDSSWRDIPVIDRERSSGVRVIDASKEYASIQSDVDRLIGIAGKLFAAIEREIRDLESAVTSTSDDRTLQRERTLFKEQLIRSSSHLDSSLRQIAVDLGQGLEALSRAAETTLS